MSRDNPPIPDPLEPEKRAIDGETGEMLHPVFWSPKAPTDRAPTLAELQDGAKLLGWGRPEGLS